MPAIDEPTIAAVVARVLKACDAGEAVRRHWPRDLGGPVHVIAFGKASVAMAKAASEVQPGIGGVVVAQPRFASEGIPGFEVWPADHPLATERNIRAAERIERLVRSLGPRDTLVALISGGGSAHLTLPREGLTLEDLRRTTEALLRAGAPIEELNCVRKHCERLKGGRLGAMCGAGRVELIVISDVLGDRLDVIASGPFEVDPTTYEDALAVLWKRGLSRMADRVSAFLEAGARGEHPETPKIGEGAWRERVRVRIGANNESATRAAEEWAMENGFAVLRVAEALTGEAAAAGREVGKRARELAGRPEGRHWCLVAGGETTVTVGESRGTGGRNQELALAAAMEIDGVRGVRIMAFGTDGVDGPTDAAGAVVDGGTCARGRALGLDAGAFLLGHDSYGFFARAGGHIKTGPTGTNVNDVVVALVEPQG